MSRRSSRPSFSVISSEDVSDLEWYDPELVVAPFRASTDSPRQNNFRSVGEVANDHGADCCAAARLLGQYEERMKIAFGELIVLKSRIRGLETENSMLMDGQPPYRRSSVPILTLVWEIIELGIGIQALCLRNLLNVKNDRNETYHR